MLFQQYLEFFIHRLAILSSLGYRPLRYNYLNIFGRKVMQISKHVPLRPPSISIQYFDLLKRWSCIEITRFGIQKITELSLSLSYDVNIRSLFVQIIVLHRSYLYATLIFGSSSGEEGIFNSYMYSLNLWCLWIKWIYAEFKTKSSYEYNLYVTRWGTYYIHVCSVA